MAWIWSRIILSMPSSKSPQRKVYTSWSKVRSMSRTSKPLRITQYCCASLFSSGISTQRNSSAAKSWQPPSTKSMNLKSRLACHKQQVHRRTWCIAALNLIAVVSALTTMLSRKKISTVLLSGSFYRVLDRNASLVKAKPLCAELSSEKTLRVQGHFEWHNPNCN